MNHQQKCEMVFGDDASLTEDELIKAVLKALVETIMEGESGRDIDAGCNGDGPLAHALVVLGMAEDTEVATDMIFGPDELDEEFDDEFEVDDMLGEDQ